MTCVKQAIGGTLLDMSMPANPTFRLSTLLAALALLTSSCAGPQARPGNVAPVPSTTDKPVATVASVLRPTVATVAPTPPPTNDAPELPADASLAQRITAFISQPRFRHANWGIDVVDLGSGQVRYAHNADKLFVPASNTKLYTAALALDTLGPDARFSTTLLATAAAYRGAAARRGSAVRQGSTLQGDLVLRGGGDPSLGNTRVAPDNADWADRMAAAVSAMGITHVSGDLIGDATYFRAPAFGNGWEADDLLAAYAPPVSALSTDGNRMAITVSRDSRRCCQIIVSPEVLDKNVINLTEPSSGVHTDPISIVRIPGSSKTQVSGTLAAGRSSQRFALAAAQPARMAALQLQKALLHHGVVIQGRVRTVHWPEKGPVPSGKNITVLARISSPPLRVLLHHMLKKSDNLFAQMLLLDVGERFAHSGNCPDRTQLPTTSEQWGLCAMRAMLQRIGIDRSEATFSEGSGLSRRNLTSPSATTTLLLWVHRQRYAQAFADALPVAGVDGTLAHRMIGSTAQNRIHAKTGTLTHVYALAGYATNTHGRPLVFALNLDRYQRPRDSFGRRLRPSPANDLDQVAAMLVGQPADAADMAAGMTSATKRQKAALSDRPAQR